MGPSSKPSASTVLVLAVTVLVTAVVVTGPLAVGTSLASRFAPAEFAATEASTPGERPGTTQTTTPTPTPTVTTTEPTRTPTTTTTTDDRRYRYTLREGANATTVHVSDSGRPGPTVVVVGGQHGNEPAGAVAARDVATWEVARGTLVVVPEANPRALDNGTREVDGRDLNAQFPVGDRPTSRQARAIWSVLVRHDADVVVDLHSSDGIYGVDGGVGQAVFPTVTGDAVPHAETAIARVNDEYRLDGPRSFRRGNAMGRSGRSLTRKVAGDLNETAYIVETTKRNTTRRTRVEWTTSVTWEVLRLHGVVSGERPAPE